MSFFLLHVQANREGQNTDESATSFYPKVATLWSAYLITTSAALRESVMKRFPLWHLQRRESPVWCLSLRMPGSLVSLSISFILSTNCLGFSSWCVGTSLWFAPQRGHMIWAISITLHRPAPPSSSVNCLVFLCPTTYIWWDREGSCSQMWTGFSSTLCELLQVVMQDFCLLTEYPLMSLEKSKFGLAQNWISVQCFVTCWLL